MHIARSQRVSQYRARGFWGGGFVGGLAGAIAAGQFTDTWAASPLHLLGAIVITAGVCALAGLLLALGFMSGQSAIPGEAEHNQVQSEGKGEVTDGAAALHVEGEP